MRKINPNHVRTDFVTSLNDLQSFYSTVKTALNSDKMQTYLAENTVLSAATLWESFVNDLFIAYINRNPSQFVVHLNNAFEEGRTPKQKQIANRYVTIGFPSHLTVREISSLIDDRGNNVTFMDGSTLKSGAKKYLAQAEFDRIDQLSTADTACISLWIALRNHIAHRSKRSYDAMNRALNAGALHNSNLNRGVREIRSVGSHLKARPQPGLPPRIEILLNRMKETAELL